MKLKKVAQFCVKICKILHHFSKQMQKFSQITLANNFFANIFKKRGSLRENLYF